MRVVIAPDKFRGSLTAAEAAQAIARGVLRACPSAMIDLAPMADGGEGFVEALIEGSGASLRQAIVSGPLGEPVIAKFALLGENALAVVEMATASGLALVPPDRRDPTRTSTRGTGDLIRAALDCGVDHLIVGIGGSATNDGGVGMAEVLGYSFLNYAEQPIDPGGGSLDQLARIDTSGINPRLKAVRVEVACDITNPLCGPQGASVIYGPQKGATPAQVRQLDANLAHLAAIISRDLGIDVLPLVGGGAAGGLGAGLVAFVGAILRSGIDLVLEATDLEGRLLGADLCFTGEGCLDESSSSGKTVAGVASLARSLGVPTFVLAGTVGLGAKTILDRGVTAYFPICPGPITLEQAIHAADRLLAIAAEQVTRAFLAGRDLTRTS